MSKKIKAEEYKDEFDEEVEDDYYEDENEPEKEVVEESPNNFKAIEDEQEDEEYYEDAKKTFRRVNTSKFMSIFNVMFILIMIIMLIISVDVICITRYNIGPFFAINTKTYKDGGTKEYYGLGYKVIKYSEIAGRRDTQIGFWNMKYSTEPLMLEDIDLAIEFQNNPEPTANKYYKKYVKILSTIKEIDNKNNIIILEYTDPDGKYTLEITCKMVSRKDSLVNYKINDKVSIKGTVFSFSIKEDTKTNKVILENCFVEQN
ncbi:MAG: hypothetical protein J6C28_01065 [Bacilli bacterium]|nr:hypothetical protein [Bacilli bacterium]